MTAAAKCHDADMCEGEVAIDDASGKYLNPEGVRKARSYEIGYIRKMKLYTKVPEAECWRMTGKRADWNTVVGH